jgi:pimeloyl-ACP methyl ester carboxylesterase
MLDGWASRCGRSRRLTVGRSHSRSGVIQRGSRSSRCMARQAAVLFGGHARSCTPSWACASSRTIVRGMGCLIETMAVAWSTRSPTYARLQTRLGFDRFGVNGGSGGGPHVLACAALLPDRVVRATCEVGVAPLGTPGLEQDAWLAGMDPENVKEFGWALAGEDILTRELQALQQQFEERARADPSRRSRRWRRPGTQARADRLLRRSRRTTTALSTGSASRSQASTRFLAQLSIVEHGW